MDCTTAHWIWINLRESFKKTVGCLYQKNRAANTQSLMQKNNYANYGTKKIILRKQ
jgi:hypothetical protein